MLVFDHTRNIYEYLHFFACSSGLEHLALNKYIPFCYLTVPFSITFYCSISLWLFGRQKKYSTPSENLYYLKIIHFYNGEPR